MSDPPAFTPSWAFLRTIPPPPFQYCAPGAQSQDAQLQTVQPQTQTVEASEVQNKDAQAQTNEDGLTNLLSTGEYSDFTVVCGKRTWRVHRAIVCSRSTYFKKVCDGDFMEAQQRKIVFEEDRETLIEQLLLYLYTMRYPQTSPTSTRAAQHILFDAQMYALADKYGLIDLKMKVKRSFERQLARNLCVDILFAAAAALVYESTLQEDRGLRDPLLDFLWDNKATLLLKPGVQECIMAHEGLKNDVLQALFKDRGSLGHQTVDAAASSATGPESRERMGEGSRPPRKRMTLAQDWV